MKDLSKDPRDTNARNRMSKKTYQGEENRNGTPQHFDTDPFISRASSGSGPLKQKR